MAGRIGFLGALLCALTACGGLAEIDTAGDSDASLQNKAKAAGGAGKDKVAVCHIPPGNPSNAHTIVVGAPAVRAHLAHGDTLGECSSTPPPEDTCGDGVIDPGETCDGDNLADQDCTTHGFIGGTLACSPDCNAFDIAGCTRSSCGDGNIDPGETCDGGNVAGQDCTSHGFKGGTLVCSPDCNAFDISGCTRGICGDGILDPGESCDGTELGGRSCVTQGFDRGTLACNANCGFDVSGCAVDQCSSCNECGSQACIDGQCGACRTQDDCCAGLLCVLGACTLF